MCILVRASAWKFRADVRYDVLTIAIIVIAGIATAVAILGCSHLFERPRLKEAGPGQRNGRPGTHLQAVGSAAGILHRPAARSVVVVVKPVRIDITHGESVGHAFLKLAKHGGVCFRHENRERPPVPGKELSQEIAVLRAVDVDHCSHDITSCLLS